MKRYKRLGILLGLLVAACAATFALTRYEEKKEQIKNSGEVILEIPADTVRTLSWETGDISLAFHKDQKWFYDGDENFPVDEDKIATLLKTFEAFGAAFTIEEVENYGQYGLDEPVCTIRLTTEEEYREIKLGDYSKMDQQRYVDIGDGNVYLASEDPLEQFDAELSDVIDHDEMPDFGQISEITFSGEENYSIFYEEDSPNGYSDEDVYFTKDDTPLSATGVDEYLYSITSLDATDYVTYHATEEELKEYGLDTPELTVTIDYTHEDGDGEEVPETFVLHISRDPEDVAAAEKSDEGQTDEEPEIAAYIRVGDSGIVYRIPSEDRQTLMAVSYNDFRHKEVFWAAFEDVNRMDVRLEGVTHTLVSRTEETEQTRSEEQQQALDMDDLLSALKALRAGSFTDEEPDGKEEISLTVYLNNEVHPQVRISLYRYDGSWCLAEVDGRSVSLVSRSYVVDLIEAVQAIVLNRETK